MALKRAVRWKLSKPSRAAFYKSAHAWEEALGSLDLCVSAVRTIDEAFDLPTYFTNVNVRDMSVQAPRADGTTETDLGGRSNSAPPPDRCAPRAHSSAKRTRKILEEYGYSPEQIKQLKDWMSFKWLSKPPLIPATSDQSQMSFTAKQQLYAAPFFVCYFSL